MHRCLLPLFITFVIAFTFCVAQAQKKATDVDSELTIKKLGLSIFLASKANEAAGNWDVAARTKFRDRLLEEINAKSFLRAATVFHKVPLQGEGAEFYQKVARLNEVDGVLAGELDGFTLRLKIFSASGREVARMELPSFRVNSGTEPQLAGKLVSLIEAQFPYRGFITKVTKGQYQLSLGSKDQLRKGQRVQAFRFRDDAKNLSGPLSPLGALEIVSVTGRNSSLATSLSTKTALPVTAKVSLRAPELPKSKPPPALPVKLPQKPQPSEEPEGELPEPEPTPAEAQVLKPTPAPTSPPASTPAPRVRRAAPRREPPVNEGEQAAKAKPASQARAGLSALDRFSEKFWLSGGFGQTNLDTELSSILMEARDYDFGPSLMVSISGGYDRLSVSLSHGSGSDLDEKITLIRESVTYDFFKWGDPSLAFIIGAGLRAQQFSVSGPILENSSLTALAIDARAQYVPLSWLKLYAGYENHYPVFASAQDGFQFLGFGWNVTAGLRFDPFDNVGFEIGANLGYARVPMTEDEGYELRENGFSLRVLGFF